MSTLLGQEGEAGLEPFPADERNSLTSPKRIRLPTAAMCVVLQKTGQQAHVKTNYGIFPP